MFRSPRPSARATTRFAAWPASVLVGLVALVAYLWLAPPVSGDGDSSELTLVLVLDGIAHPTGYPLYTRFGHLFVSALHRLGTSWASAAAAWSALGAATAVAFMHALAVRLVPREAVRRGPLLAALPLIPVSLFFLNPAWTAVATVTEVYTWHLAWVMAAGLGLALHLQPLDADLPGAAATPRSPVTAAAWGLLGGAGLAHHLSSTLVMAPLAWTLLRARRRGRVAGRSVLVAAAAGLAPLSSYLLLRAKMDHPGPAAWVSLESTWAGFLRHVTGVQYGGALGRFSPAGIEQQWLATAVYPFLFPGLILAAGAWALARGAARSILGALLVVALIQTGFGFAYGVSDPSAYFLAPLALGLVMLAPLLAALASLGDRVRAIGVGATIVLGLLALALWGPWTRAALDLRATRTSLDGMLRSMWTSIPFEHGVVLWRNDMYQRLREYQLLRGEKSRLDVINPWTFTDPVVRRRFASRYGFDPVGPLTLSRRDLLATGPESRSLRRYFAAVAERINRNTDLPVILFAPEVPEVRLLSKPGGGSLRGP